MSDSDRKWDVVDARSAGAGSLPQLGSRKEAVVPSIAKQLELIQNLPTGLAKMAAKHDAMRQMVMANRQRIETILAADLARDKARLDLELTKALALIREEWLTFIAGLGLAQLERRREVASQLEDGTKQWLLDIAERDMPDFMRSRQMEAVIQSWEKMFALLMQDDLPTLPAIAPRC